MRILSLIDSLAVGGGQRIMRNLIEGMPEHEHLVAYFYKRPNRDSLLEPPGDFNIPCRQINEKIVNFYPDFMEIPDGELAESLKNIIHEFEPDIILRHFWGGRETRGRPLPLPRVKKEKYICVIHDSCPAPLDYDFYIVTGMYNDLKCQQHIPCRKKRLVYNGIDLKRFSPARKPHPGFIIGRVSTLMDSKIPADWIEFTDSFDIPGVKFITAGEGPRRAEFEKRIAERSLRERHSLPGNIPYDDVPEWLGGFDLCCYLTDTHIETHSMMLLEMAAAGVPVVAEPRGSIPEQVLHGRTGFLAREKREIKEICEWLARDPKLLQELSEGSRVFGKNFTIESQCRQYRRIFEHLIPGSRIKTIPKGENIELSESGSRGEVLPWSSFLQIIYQVYLYFGENGSAPESEKLGRLFNLPMEKAAGVNRDPAENGDLTGLNTEQCLNWNEERKNCLANRYFEERFENIYLRNYLQTVQGETDRLAKIAQGKIDLEDDVKNKTKYIIDLKEDIKTRLEDIANKQGYIEDLQADLKNRLEDIGNKSGYIKELEGNLQEKDKEFEKLAREREAREGYIRDLEKRFLNRLAISGYKFFNRLLSGGKK